MSRRRRVVFLVAGVCLVGMVSLGGCIIPGVDEWEAEWESKLLGGLHSSLSVAVFDGLARMILVTPAVQGNEPVARTLGVVRVLAGGLLVLAVMWSGLRGVLGLSFKSLPMVAGQAVLALAGMSLTPLAVDTLTGLVNQVVGVVMGAAGGAVALEVVKSPPGNGLAIILFWVVALAVGVNLLVGYYVRLVELYFLVAVSPVAWVLAVGDQFRPVMGTWAREVAVLAVTPLAHSLQLLLLSAMLTGAAGGPPSFEQLLLSLAALLFMVKTPTWLRRFIHASPDPVAALKQIVGALTLRRRLR